MSLSDSAFATFYSLVRSLSSSLSQEMTVSRPAAARTGRATARRRSLTGLSFETLERRDVPATAASPLASVPLAAYSVTGAGNNLLHPTWGSTGTDLLRIAPAAYGDGLSTPAGADRPSARMISNALADQARQDIISDRQLSAMIYAWGQFIDHDLDLTPSGNTEPFAIPVPSGDPSFDPAGTGTQTIPISRSLYDVLTGITNPREQVNTITSFLDGSMIYGSDAETAAALRTFSGGLLKTSTGNLLPLNDSATFPQGTLDMANAGPTPRDSLYAAGDVRANENIELTSLHTLFVREHNSWARRLAAATPGLTDEQLFQKARAIVIAEVQAITYNEWLPALLGRGLAPYTGYKPGVNPGISNEFSTAAFRMGHSLLGDDVEFLDNNGKPIRDEVSLSEAFFNPTLVAETGIDPILKYLASDPASEIDTKVVDSVRNFLFGPPGAGGLDLVSLNIQRGRDHGLADYNTTRQAYGLPPVTSFAQITSDPQTQARLQELYGTVNDIDLWVGVLAERHVPGASVGPTLRAILSNQFTRLRDGDRFWYERTFTGPMLRALRNTTLSDIVRRNTSLTNVQKDAFFFRAGIRGTVFNDGNGDGRAQPRERGLAGIRVELVDKVTGEVLATRTTDRRGFFSFGVLDGIRTGDYFVRTVVPEGSAQPAAVSSTISITRGEQLAERVNLGVKLTKAAPRPAPTTMVNPEVLDVLFALANPNGPNKRR